MPYWYLILQVSNFVFSPSFFFFGPIKEQSTAKNKNNPKYFCHSIKNCNCCPGISLVWSTVRGEVMNYKDFQERAEHYDRKNRRHY